MGGTETDVNILKANENEEKMLVRSVVNANRLNNAVWRIIQEIQLREKNGWIRIRLVCHLLNIQFVSVSMAVDQRSLQNAVLRNMMCFPYCKSSIYCCFK